MSKIIDGKTMADEIYNKISAEVKKYDTKPKLVFVLVGKDPASEIYVMIKEKVCKRTGIISQTYRLPKITEDYELVGLIEKLNKDKSVHGILIQLPLPKNIDTNRILVCISADKDVDGLNPVNMGKTLTGDETLAPCAPKGIITLLENEGINVEGKNITIISHSSLVGKPLAMMLLNRNATVDICHIKTKNLAEHTKRADILIVGAGVPKLITKDMVKDGAVVIDVGINRIEGKIIGDVDFENVKDKASFITPVPGGIGPMTVAMLMENTMEVYRLQNKI